MDQENLTMRLLKSNVEMGQALTEAMILLRRWVAWENGKHDAVRGLVEESKKLYGGDEGQR